MTILYSINYKTVASVGNCLSVNLLVSSTPGIIAHIYGLLGRQCYQYACLFVDHQYEFTYVHILKSHTVDESVEAKEASESYTESHGVDIKYYYA